MTEAENKHIIMARIQVALARHGVYTTQSLEVTEPTFTGLTYDDNGKFKLIYSTDYTEEQLLDVWSRIESEGVNALARL